MNLNPKVREALEALAEVVNKHAAVFRPWCPDHGEECGCQRHLTGLVLVHEWTRLEDDLVSMSWHSGIGTGYFQSIGMLTEASRGEGMSSDGE